LSYSNYKQSNNRGFGSRPNRNRGSGHQQPKKDYIAPSRFIQRAKQEVNSEYVAKHNFDDFDFDPLIRANLKSMGFTTPSAIQDESIASSLQGRDIVGIANTGTGKTAAFAIPVLNQLLRNRQSMSLILAPTRELAQQLEEEFRRIAKGSGLLGALLIGGVAMGPQLRDLSNRPRIVIGTPGRVKDHANRGSVRLGACNLVVLDEVDRMLDMGFINDIRHILNQTNTVRQSFFFSATLDDKVKTVIDNFSKDPLYVEVKNSTSNNNIEQDVITYSSSSDKIDKLHNLLIQDGVSKSIVFDDTHRSVERLAKDLQARGFAIDAIHGGKSQASRQRALKRFKDNQVNVLVATDVAARGIDIADITHVINYSLPQSYGDYVHRIGRVGRVGRLGYALTFIKA
jgi:superfamily II DNA/RNA helicase